MSSSGLVAHFVTGGKRKHVEEKLDQDIYQRVVEDWYRKPRRVESSMVE